MLAVWNIVTTFFVSLFKSRQTLLLEILALRQQLIVLQRKAPKRPNLQRNGRHRGIGTSILPFRMHCPGEIVRVTLRRGPETRSIGETPANLW